MLNYNQVKYSLMHRDVVKLLAKKYVNDPEFLKRVEYHDMDKVLLYMQESILLAHSKHLEFISHHLESNIKKNKDDYMEIIIDWDSARYTKADKLLNAYQTLNRLYPSYYEVMIPFLKELNLDHEYEPIDENILSVVLSNNYDEFACLREVAQYVKYIINNKINLYYDIYGVLSNIFATLTIDEKKYLEDSLGEEIMNKVNRNKKVRIGLFTHRGCDYDAVCSTLTLAGYIISLTNDDTLEVIPVIEDSPLIKKVNNNLKTYTVDEVKDIDFDYAVICDVFESDRIYGLKKILNVPENCRYVIDHHDMNREEIDLPKSNKMIFPAASSTCEIIVQLLNFLEYSIKPDEANNLYRGIASDTAIFKRSVSDNTIKMVNLLNISEEEKNSIIEDLTRMSPIQEQLFNKIKVDEHSTDCLKIFSLLEPIEAGDITKHVKHEKFDKLTGPTNDNPVTCFIIGCGNNYFLKFKKLPESDVDILTIATNCNGGGHETRCAGRFYETTYEEVLNKLFMEYNKLQDNQEQKNLKRSN